MKECRGCDESKHESEFAVCRSRPDGLQIYCKKCLNEKNKKWRDDNPEKANASKRNWEKNNPDKVKAQAKRCRIKDIERSRERGRKANKKQRLGNPDGVRNRSLKHKFGITIEQYREKLDNQGGRCAICSRHQDEFKVALMVDHNHATGAVRGLLCGDCNKGLGLIRDSIEFLKKLIRYLTSGDSIIVLEAPKRQDPIVAWVPRTPEGEFSGHIKRKFGITIEFYNEMFSRQSGQCAICGRDQSAFIDRLSIDHDHKTGKIRGLLCGDCNRMLGMFRDSAEILERAIRFLAIYS